MRNNVMGLYNRIARWVLDNDYRLLLSHDCLQHKLREPLALLLILIQSLIISPLHRPDLELSGEVSSLVPVNNLKNMHCLGNAP